MDQTPQQRAADLIASETNYTGREACFCIGACYPDPANCPVQVHARMPLAERLEIAASLQEFFGHPDIAALIRAAP